MSPKENYRNYPLRRQSAISDFKPKVRKKLTTHTLNFHLSFTLHLFFSKILMKGLKVESCQSSI